MSYFEMVSPESAGIRRQGIESFLKAAEGAGLELHRFMMLRHGKCVAKITWDPYRDDDMHPLFSFSKSITATAIGFAVQEGILSLDEKLVDIFPEDVPEEPDENLRACEIRHLLTMSCGHDTEAIDAGPDWRKTFFSHPFLHRPGTFYLYNTLGSNVLASVIVKKTGQQVTEYLRPRLLDRLGIGEIPCFILPDDLHTEHGGGGMSMTQEDMAKFTQFMLQDGVWEGEPLLKGWYHAQAGKKQIETEGDSYGHVKDWALGYGYQCWMCNLPGSFRADGAFGQFGLVYPSLDLCIITSSATEQTQTMIDAVNEYILPNVLREDSADISNNTDAGPISEQRRLPALLNCRNPLFEACLSESVYEAEDSSRMDGIKKLVGGAGERVYDGDMHIEKISFSFDEKHVILHITENGQMKELTAALDHSFSPSFIDGTRYEATARWRSLRRLEMEIRNMEAISGVRLILNFEDGRMWIDADETLMTDGGLGMVDRKLVPFRQTADLKDISLEVTGNNPGKK